MGWGSSTRSGDGQKVRALPRKFVFLGLEGRNLGCPGNFAGMSRTPGGVQKVRAKKFARMFLSLIRSEAGRVRSRRVRSGVVPKNLLSWKSRSWYWYRPEPKGPFRTKNATALNSVVFCYRRSFLLSVVICCLISLKNSGFKVSTVVFYYRRSECTTDSKFTIRSVSRHF